VDITLVAEAGLTAGILQLREHKPTSTTLSQPYGEWR